MKYDKFLIITAVQNVGNEHNVILFIPVRKQNMGELYCLKYSQ